MRLHRFAAAVALPGMFASPLVAERQGETTTALSSAPTVDLAVSTKSNGEPTTFEVFAPRPSSSEASKSVSEDQLSVTPTSTVDLPSSTSTYEPTGAPFPASAFNHCEDPNARPFCLPTNGTDLYVGNYYYATWNPDFFPHNSSIVVKVQYRNDSSYTYFELDFVALWIEDGTTSKAKSAAGPMVTVKNAPPRYLPPSQTSKFHKEGIMIGLPVSLGFVLLVVVGLFFGMRKQRKIGLGNIMGRQKRGYATRKSKRERLGLGKKGAIRLEEVELPNRPRNDSLGSLVSEDDEIRPAPRGNHFRDELQRQKTGR
ncbi:hypothetical protein M011DRAFT_485085 [Sporormia fimetaria CBS 119925]|uniref:Mid2 domain-containing protein n=1 Tax=Sporormia fimetaria CBS 119925 TaxID=1340428 RepID=A0A6A6VIR1_9PLEO|nr:hypothetical protein M011DRAFT_485085 [Sporormia fimetaria CBS 119925]